MAIVSIVPRLVLGLGITSIFITGFLVAVPVPVAAQEASLLEEIVVTARRREESLQDIPMSIVAFQDEEIALTGLREFEDLNVIVPNLSINAASITGETGTVTVMRGIPGVVTYVDGIETTGSSLLTREFRDLERIEVLRGPQGTLFGRGTMGGAVQLITTRPGDDFGGRIQATGGNLSRGDFKATVDVPIGERIKTRFSGAVLKRDAYVENLEPGGTGGGDVDDKQLRIDLFWEATDNFAARFLYDHNEFERDGNARVLGGMLEGPSLFNVYRPLGFVPITMATDFSTEEGIGEWNIRSSRKLADTYTQDLDQYSLFLDWDVTESITLRSLTGYRTNETSFYNETDGTRYQLFDEILYIDSDTLTQEIQILGSFDRFNFVAGNYYRDLENRNRRTLWAQGDIKRDPALLARARMFRLPLLPPLQNIFGGSEDETNATFGELTWDVNDRLSLSLGLRYNEDIVLNTSLDASARISPAPGAAISWSDPILIPIEQALAGTRIAALDFEESFESTTGRAVVQYAFNEQMTSYFSYSQGFGPGAAGIASDPQLPAPVAWKQDPEEVEMWELGFKSNLVDNRMRLNAAVFSGTWDKIQLAEAYRDPDTGVILPVPIPTNAGQGKVDGLEVDISWLPSQAWMLNLNFGYVDARYTEVGRATTIDEGTKFLNTPELSWSLSAQNRFEFANGANLISRLNYGWVDEYFTTADSQAQLTQEAYGLLNLRFVYTTPTERFSATLFGDNLTEEYYLTGGRQALPIGSLLTYAGRPREYGITVDIRF